MNKPAAALLFAALLGGSTALAEPAPQGSTLMVGADPVTGKKTVRKATPAERAQIQATMKNLEPSLAAADAALRNLGPTLAAADAALKTLGPSLAALEGLDGLEERIARLERMVETETPVSTTTTHDGLVRVYRDGTIVTDSSRGRTYETKD